MRRLTFLLATLGTSVVFCAIDASAATIHVPGEQPTIQAGIDAAQNGDSVLVDPGAYIENLRIVGKAIYLNSTAGAASTTLTATEGDILYLDTPAPDTTWIQGLTVRDGTRVGIYGTGGIVVQDCRFKNFGTAAIYLNQAPGAIVQRNRFDLPPRDGVGITFDNASGLQLTNNTFHGGTSAAVRILFGRARIRNNTFVQCWPAVNGSSSDTVVVLNNIFLHCGEAVLSRSSVPVAEGFNDFYANATDVEGIDLSATSFRLDPLLVDTADLDFRLTYGSPCIDAGDPNAQYNDPDLSRNDIGAFSIQCPQADDDCDGDGLVNSQDNCPGIANPGQPDADSDGVGDVCDKCPAAYNPGQADTDVDGYADACDNCPDVSNASQWDSDDDGLGDVCDNCAADFNPDQLDGDLDGIGDACDPCPNDTLNDLDGDGVCTGVDNCPLRKNHGQYDSDEDGVGDACDNCLYASNPAQEDNDLDGIGDSCECRCQCFADPACDSVMTDVRDVILTINVAFRHAGVMPDRGPYCFRDDTDVDCTGDTSVLDVVLMINVAFRGANAATDFCNPCL